MLRVGRERRELEKALVLLEVVAVEEEVVEDGKWSGSSPLSARKKHRRRKRVRNDARGVDGQQDEQVERNLQSPQFRPSKTRSW